LYCVFSISAEPIGLYLVDEKDKFYFWAGFTIFEYTISSYFFYLTFKKKKIVYIPIIGTLIFYLIVGVSFYNKNLKGFDSISASMEAILVIIYCIVFLYDQITNPEVMYLFNTKKFWIVIAFFLYFSSTLFLFLFAASFTKEEHSNYWVINNFFDILKNTFFCISFAMKKSDSNQNSIKSFNPDIL